MRVQQCMAPKGPEEVAFQCHGIREKLLFSPHSRSLFLVGVPDGIPYLSKLTAIVSNLIRHGERGVGNQV